MQQIYLVMGAMIVALAIAGLSPLSGVAQAQSGVQLSSELDVWAVPSLDAEGIRAVQNALLERNIKPGPIDGIYGPRTAGAIKAFQERFGMEPSGKIDNQLLLALGIPEVSISASQ